MGVVSLNIFASLSLIGGVYLLKNDEEVGGWKGFYSSYPLFCGLKHCPCPKSCFGGWGGGGGLQREPGKNQDRKPFKGLFNLVGSLCFHGPGSVPYKNRLYGDGFGLFPTKI